MIKPDFTFVGAASQPTSLLDARGFPAVNGFDSGMSQPKMGSGFGLLGDVGSHASAQDCADCLPSDPCPNCSDGDGGSNADTVADAGAQGRIIKVQGPGAMPMPGMAPPLPIGVSPQPPRIPNNVVVGDPDAWWNWTPYDIQNWLNGTMQSKAAKEVEEMCEEEYASDTIKCNVKKAYAGANAGRACHESAAKRYADCLKHGRKSDIPLFDRE